ncbi:hypothetical protein PR08_gp39 [Idiomarinaceae phage Phi1M2-2]|uniref:hypothetical protein n=1 Tax=Idiomarinaceae phage Phi1M2-2 TaxID=1527515 RepID=UPI0004F8F189|nr:hypothetical protein PR08_gp39 [Idiomarinaceae phage Phi1M2-2]AIM40796.1 hypothetical protein M22_039 [Idiomarinaceae phage Phi1M2-2]
MNAHVDKATHAQTKALIQLAGIQGGFHSAQAIAIAGLSTWECIRRKEFAKPVGKMNIGCMGNTYQITPLGWAVIEDVETMAKAIKDLRL